MTKEIFLPCSRRDQEFVTRLASDLDAQVAGVWFDQSAIQAGENWHDEIMESIGSASPSFWYSPPMQWNLVMCVRK